MSAIDIAKLRRLHKSAGGDDINAALGPTYELANGCKVRSVLTEAGGAPMLEHCLPSHAAYACEAWNVAPKLADEVERLRAAMTETASKLDAEANRLYGEGSYSKASRIADAADVLRAARTVTP